MTDPYYADIKQWKRDSDRQLEELNEKVAEEAKSRKKMVDEMKKMREDIKLLKELCMEGDEYDGFHNRHRCFDAIKERLQGVKEEVAEDARIRKKTEDELKKILEDIKLLKELCGC
ncbi:hypothetical protein F2Q70_00036486 [Brassica cretica]|uniref:Uncharacterized protein n=1 Tax=Brassica cretica TaxID=69181 RepID=A0A8S9K199_BRACR|nr:hypothetical protein F2Q70_00036486 [Brassica cretica]